MNEMNKMDGNAGKNGILIGALTMLAIWIIADFIVIPMIKTVYPADAKPNSMLIPSPTIEASPDFNVLIDAGSETAFTVKGTITANAEIDGETHRLVCYRVTVSDFWLSHDTTKANMIGADEEFTTFIQADGAVAYRATYYEQLSDNKGIKVVKEFMDCGIDNEYVLAGTETPLYIEFSQNTGYFSGILDSYDKGVIPTVTFK